MRIAVDIDGVLFPWDDAARDTLADRFGILLGPSWTWQAIRENAGRQAWDWLWTAEGQDAVFSQNDRRHADAVLAVNEVLRMGHEVHFVTHRDPQRTLVHTADFLARYFGRGPRWAGVHSIKGSTSKRSLGPWDVMIDDKTETVLDMVARETNMVFAPLRPWNADELVDREGPHLHVYTDPMDIVRWVEARA